MNLLQNKVTEILSEKLDKIFKEKLVEKGVKKFAWTFEVEGDDLFLTKIVTQRETGEVRTTNEKIRIKDFLSGAINNEK